MEVYFPAYYHSFQCIAGACPDSCCKEWAVDVDDGAVAFYRGLDGDLGDRLRSVLQDTPDGTVMTIENGRCPMWRADGLCRIQAELGHGALCETCRNFPRLRHDYGDFVELGLELSCPEAARLILSHPGGMLVQAQPGGTEPDYDTEVMAVLRSSRKEALDFLRSAKHVPNGLAAVLLFAHGVQGAIDRGDATYASIEDCAQQVLRYRGDGDLQPLFALFRSLEILTNEWEHRLAQPACSIIWDETLQNLARYMIERYWLQAVSDFDLVCRVKLAVAACLLVCALGGDRVQTAQLFSKEIENDPDNVEALLDAAYTSPALTDANLLALLLG